MKIDRIFTIKALQNEYDYRLLVYIIDMIHSLGLYVVIEGIETKEELQRIAVLQPDYIQGYYFSRPCTQEEFFLKYHIEE